MWFLDYCIRRYCCFYLFLFLCYFLIFFCSQAFKVYPCCYYFISFWTKYFFWKINFIYDWSISYHPHFVSYKTINDQNVSTILMSTKQPKTNSFLWNLWTCPFSEFYRYSWCCNFLLENISFSFIHSLTWTDANITINHETIILASMT